MPPAGRDYLHKLLLPTPQAVLQCQFHFVCCSPSVFTVPQPFVVSFSSVVAIDTILANSYFDQFTPLICERLVCGQDLQTMYQIDIPTSFVNRKFVDIFRAFLSKRIFILAIYRSPDVMEGSLLPYVCTCPRPDLEMRSKDRLFVYCNPVELDYALNAFLKLPIRIETKGAITVEYMGENGTQQIVPKLLRQGYNMMI